MMNMKQYVNILKYFNMHLTKGQINNTSKKLYLCTCIEYHSSMRCSTQVNRRQIKVDAYPMMQVVSSSLSVYTGSLQAVHAATYCIGVRIASMLGQATALLMILS